MPSPPLNIQVEPLDGAAVRWLRLAAPAPGGAERAKLVLRLEITNSSALEAVTITAIDVRFPGSSVGAVQMFRPDLVLDDEGDGGRLEPGETKFWSSGVVNVKDSAGNVIQEEYNAIYLDLPAPKTASVRISATGDVTKFTRPAIMPIDLAEYRCPEEDQGYPLFLRQGDLPSAAVLTIEGRHWANGGGRGGQIYAYDVGVERWVDGAWTMTKPKAGKGPDAWYAYGLPIRSVAAGTVHALVDGIEEGPDFGEGNHGGNRIHVEHTNGERSYYTHLQKGSFRVGVGDAVQAGTVLGLLGFSGNTSHPHCHITILRHDDGALRPYAFRDCWIRDAGSDTPFDPEPSSNWVSMPRGRGIPDGDYHLWASSKRPAWYPPGWAEVFKFGVPESEYQEMFDRVTYAGYRPELVDVYEHGGRRFYNAIFRPKKEEWRAEHHMNFKEYQAAYDQAKADGYRLHNIASYPRGRGVNYAAIWLQVSGPRIRAYHRLTIEEHDAQVERNERDGYHPVNVSVASPSGSPSYSALWVKSDAGGWRSKSMLTPDAYQELWNEQAGDLSRHATYVSGWQLMPDGPPMLSAIFKGDAPGSGRTFGRHGMSRSELQEEYTQRIGSDWLIRAVAGYVEGGRPTFAAIWRKA